MNRNHAIGIEHAGHRAVIAVCDALPRGADHLRQDDGLADSVALDAVARGSGCLEVQLGITACVVRDIEGGWRGRCVPDIGDGIRAVAGGEDLAEAVILGRRVAGKHHGAARGNGALVQRQPDEAVRFGESGLLPIGVGLFEERRRDGRGMLAASDAVGDFVPGIRLVKAHPDGDGQLRVVGSHPDVAVAAAHGDGARLAGDGRVGGEHARARAAGDDGLKQRGHQIRVLLGDDAPAAVFVLIDHVAAGGYDLLHAVWLVIHAAVGVRHIGRRQLHGRDAVGH